MGGLNVIIFGGSGGIGRALIKEIRGRFPKASIFATWHSSKPDISDVYWCQVDVTSEEQISAFAKGIGDVHWIVNAVGLLHTEDQSPEKTIRDFDTDFFRTNIDANVVPTLLIAKHFMKHLRHKQPSVFATVSARVGSIGDNRLGGWYSYRCAKAALNMAIKNISIEWQRVLPDVCVTALHPGTTDSGLSAPFQKNVPAQKLFSPVRTASQLLDIIERARPQATGNFYSWDHSQIPW